MADFNDFLNELKSELATVAKSAGGDIKDQLWKDGKDFATKSKNDLKLWMTQLAEGKLTRDELEYLLKAKKDLAEMEALKQKGLAQARIDKLKNALIKSVVGSALRTIK